MKNETDVLNKAIIVLQEKHLKDLQLLQEHFYAKYEGLKPVNISNYTFNEDAASPKFNGKIIGNVMGVVTGFLVKKLMVGRSHNPFKRLIGTMVQFAIANEISKHADSIKSAAENLLNRYWINNSESKRKALYVSEHIELLKRSQK